MQKTKLRLIIVNYPKITQKIFDNLYFDFLIYFVIL